MTVEPSAAGLAIVALTTRMLPSDVPPLTGRELAALRRQTDVSALPGLDAASVAGLAGIPLDTAERVRRLLDRATAAALALESLEQSGIWTLTVADDEFPARVRALLGDAAPPVLHGAGERVILGTSLLGVVGSRRVTPAAAAVATAAGDAAARRGIGVVSGGARGIDALAMDAARAAGGRAVGVLAESLTRTTRAAAARRAVLDGSLTLLTPYAPGAGFSTGQAMGRNKVIYALATRVLVVATDHERGGTWAGATEALSGGLADVAVWTADGSGEGNAALVARGARGVADIDAVFAAPPRGPVRRDRGGGDQMSFAV